jgi:hypothetical protein
MSNTFDDMIKEATGLPWEMGARLMVELRSSVHVPEQPVMTKEAALGMIKIARMSKIAQTPEEAQAMAQEAAMTDPNVVAAMDHQQAASEREMLMGKIQELQVANESAQAQVEMANQAAQAASQQSEQTQAMLEQAHTDRTMAVQESMAAKDQALQTQVAGQQHRHQIAQAAEQMAEQLKSLAATSPEQQQAEQVMAQQQMAEQQAAAQQAPAGGEAAGGVPAAKQKTKKEVDEAANAQQQAQVQGAQAEQAVAEEQAQAEQAAMMGGMGPAPAPGAPPAGGPPAAGMPPKMGSAKESIRNQLLQKRAYYRRGPLGPIAPEPRERLNKPSWRRDDDWKQRDHFNDLLALREMKKGKPLTDAEIDEVVTFYNKVTGAKIPMVKDWRGGSVPWTAFDKTAAAAVLADPADRILMHRDAISVERAAMIAKKANEFRRIKTAGPISGAVGGAMYRQHARGEFPDRKKEDVPGTGWGVIGGALTPDPITGAAAGYGTAWLADRSERNRRRVERDGPKPKKSNSGKGRRDAEKTSASRMSKTSEVDENGYPFGPTQNELPTQKHAAANMAAIGEGAKLLGYAGAGALAGGGLEARRLKTHEKKFGRDKPTNREVELSAKLTAATTRLKRNPTYGNKLRVANLKYKLETETMGREHPNKAVARGAARGALAGLAVGPFAHRLVAKGVKARG